MVLLRGYSMCDEEVFDVIVDSIHVQGSPTTMITTTSSKANCSAPTQIQHLP